MSVTDISGSNVGTESVDTFSKHLSLTSPDKLDETVGRKISMNGTKHIAMHCPGRLYVKNEKGDRTYIDLVMSEETWRAKKLEAELIMGTAALLGQRHYDGTQTVEDTLIQIPDMLEARGYPADGRFLMYDENDQAIGYCYASMHRAFVMKEDENLASSFKPNGMSNSPWSVNLFGGELSVSARNMDTMQKQADTVALGELLRAEIRAEKDAAKKARLGK